jgi:hypothetical protein
MSREQQIMQALARGYCVEPNTSKVLDSDLIMAMTQEVLKSVGFIPKDDSHLVEKQVRQKTADIGITEQPEKPEDMPKTITVLTHDFIQLIMIAGSLCHPQVKEIYKQRIEGDIRKIALRHHINYVGEIKG